MPIKIKLEVIKEKLSKIYPEQIFDYSNYKNMSSKIKAIDPIYGEWNPTVQNLLSRKRCHKKSVNRGRKMPLYKIKDRLLSVHGDMVIIDETTYINTQTKCRFIDKDFGEFWMLPYHVFKGSGHKKRSTIKNTNKMKLPLDEFKNRLNNISKDIILDDSTYNGLYKKAKFIHSKYGVWWALPNNIIYKNSSHPAAGEEKRVSTCIEKYGHSFPMKNRTIFIKASKSRWRKVILKHWKTNQEIICISSYEFAIVSYLNSNKIDYDWQVKINLPNNLIYFVDLFLKKELKYVEIKGIFWSVLNKEKWELFNSIYPNSEIWYIDNIKMLVKKSEYKIRKEFKENYNNQILINQ
jgi:hypothetical protein